MEDEDDIEDDEYDDSDEQYERRVEDCIIHADEEVNKLVKSFQVNGVLSKRSKTVLKWIYKNLKDRYDKNEW